MAAARVLLVDDEEDFAAVVAQRMRDRGFEVDVAHSGPDGIKQIQSATYDAVLLDLAMPGMGGMETMKAMLEIDKDLQIIILTGYGSVQRGVEAVKEGAADFLEKPADIDTVAGKVTEAQARRVDLFEKGLDDKMSDIMRRKGW
jgi:DNA-binding NtrC family response regulator